MAKPVRDPAVILSCKEFLEARHVAGTGWDPGYLEVDGRNIRRVNIIGLLVYNGDGFIVIDDGSGSVYVNTANAEKVDLPSLGEPVLVIGTPRRHENYNYISAEIVSKTRKEWLETRKRKGEAVIRQETGTREEIPLEVVESFNKEKKIRELIKEMDTDQGIDVHELLMRAKQLGIDEQEAERIIDELLKKGEIYELRPGRIRPL